jgi:large conductance mechanosensitive channel
VEGSFFGDLRRFLKTDSVVELVSAVAIGFALFGLIQAVVDDLIRAPIDEGAGGLAGFTEEHGYVTIGGRLFDYEDPLFALAIFGVVLLAVALVIRWSRQSIFADDLYDSCPHCLAEIPVGALVCSFCTRDLPPAGDLASAPA